MTECTLTLNSLNCSFRWKCTGFILIIIIIINWFINHHRVVTSGALTTLLKYEPHNCVTHATYINKKLKKLSTIFEAAKDLPGPHLFSKEYRKRRNKEKLVQAHKKRFLFIIIKGIVADLQCHPNDLSIQMLNPKLLLHCFRLDATPVETLNQLLWSLHKPKFCLESWFLLYSWSKIQGLFKDHKHTFSRTKCWH